MYRSRLAMIVAAVAVSAGVAAQPYDPNAQGYPPQGYPPPGYQPGQQTPYAPPPGAPGSPYAAPPQGQYYATQPQPAYPPPPAYAVPAVPPGQPYIGPDGLTYVNGVPVYYDAGSYFPLVFVAGLGWGYYGFGHRFFGAPGPLLVRLNRFYPGGRGFPYGGGFRGGEGRGGGFHGGEFHGGEFHGGEFHGGGERR